MTTDPDAPAFSLNRNAFDEGAPGLTKGEYFAAMALQGLLAGNPDASSVSIAEAAVLYADALVKELNGVQQ